MVNDVDALSVEVVAAAESVDVVVAGSAVVTTGGSCCRRRNTDTAKPAVRSIDMVLQGLEMTVLRKRSSTKRPT